MQFDESGRYYMLSQRRYIGTDETYLHIHTHTQVCNHEYINNRKYHLSSFSRTQNLHGSYTMVT